ncbi:MAG: proteasome subunit alpha [Acidimicrobiia bacterium]
MSMPMYVPPAQLFQDRADYARKGIARGRSVVVLEFELGVLLMGRNPSGSLHKIAEVYDRIAFAGVGRFNEFETLRVAGIRYADLKGYSYGRTDVTAKGLANAYAQTLGQIFTHEVKPYEIEVMVAEIGDEPGDTRLYRIQFDGTLADVTGFGAMGGEEEDLQAALEERYESGLGLPAALDLAASALEAVEERPIEAEGWEAAVLDRTISRRTFRRLPASEITAARS